MSCKDALGAGALAALVVLGGVLCLLYLARVHYLGRLIRDRLAERMEERERIARDLHDTLIQGVQGLIMQFQSVADHLAHDPAAQAVLVPALDRAEEMLVEGRESTFNSHTIITTFERTGARLGIETQVISPRGNRPAAAEMRQFGCDIAHMSPRPDGIICDSELRSIFMIAGLEDEGVMAGRDFHFICKQTSDLLPALYPQIDTVEEDVFTAGMELARLLIRRINGEPAETLRTLGEPKVNWRD